MSDIPAYKDPTNEGNSPEYHSGKKCITRGCDNPAGTAWSHLWCHPCNVKRMDRIDASFARIMNEMERKP